MVLNMLVSISIIIIIIIGSGSRMYFRKKFDVSEHFQAIDHAIKKQSTAKGKMHSVQNQ